MKVQIVTLLPLHSINTLSELIGGPYHAVMGEIQFKKSLDLGKTYERVGDAAPILFISRDKLTRKNLAGGTFV